MVLTLHARQQGPWEANQKGGLHFFAICRYCELTWTTADREVHEELRFQLLWGRRGRERRITQLEAFGKGMEPDGSARQVRERRLAGAELEESHNSYVQATFHFAESELISQSSSSLFPLPFFICQRFLPVRIWCQDFQHLCCLELDTSNHILPGIQGHLPEPFAGGKYYQTLTALTLASIFQFQRLRWGIWAQQTWNISSAFDIFFTCFYSCGRTTKHIKSRLRHHGISCRSSPCCMIYHNLYSSTLNKQEDFRVITLETRASVLRILYAVAMAAAEMCETVFSMT